jgi:hypothetical protein
MVAVVLCLFVFVVAGVLVIREGLPAVPVQRATTPRRTRRASPPGPPRRTRAATRLVAAVTGAGLATGVLLVLLLALLAVGLRAAGGNGP